MKDTLLFSRGYNRSRRITGKGIEYISQIQDRKEKWNRYQIVRKPFGIEEYVKISGGEKNLTSSHEPHMKI
ncbi:MAG: hypothetical protein M1113_04775 [Candidatus Thermoplasmatota archaeon]|nr:hypothetical protein [Candidatus Thermoplasmatota archaeon]